MSGVRMINIGDPVTMEDFERKLREMWGDMTTGETFEAFVLRSFLVTACSFGALVEKMVSVSREQADVLESCYLKPPADEPDEPQPDSP